MSEEFTVGELEQLIRESERYRILMNALRNEVPDIYILATISDSAIDDLDWVYHGKHIDDISNHIKEKFDYINSSPKDLVTKHVVPSSEPEGIWIEQEPLQKGSGIMDYLKKKVNDIKPNDYNEESEGEDVE